MKILALNSSPHAEERSKTELMLKHLVTGMREAGAQVDTVQLRNKTVKNCIGCYTCWTKTPGQCIHKDDMTVELFPKWQGSDLVVYATPLYHFTLNATMKAFIERTLPSLQPFFKQYKGRTYHPLRRNHPAVVMLSVAGFTEDTVFDQLSSYAKTLFGPALVGEIYRAAAETMVHPAFKDKVHDILAATSKAGKELVKSTKISPDTLMQIRQPIVDFESLAPAANLTWKTCIEQGLTPNELKEKGIIPRPDSIEAFMSIFQMGFNPETAGDTEAVLQFAFTGEREGSCYFSIQNGTIQAAKGTAEKPSLTIKAPFEVWMDVLTGKADRQRMFREKRYIAEGDISLLMQINRLFGR